MKLTNKRLQKIIKEEIRAITEEEEDWSEGLEDVLDYLGYYAKHGGAPWKSSPLALLSDYADVNITPSEDEHGGAITITWERKQASPEAIDADDLRDAWDEEDYDQSAARGGD